MLAGESDADLSEYKMAVDRVKSAECRGLAEEEPKSGRDRELGACGCGDLILFDLGIRNLLDSLLK